MQKLLATIKKDLRILTRDRVGLILMFLMPVVLAIVITVVQNSTFELVNNNKISLIISNRDTGDAAKQLTAAIQKVGMFNVELVPGSETDKQISDRMNPKDALVAVVIPENFSAQLEAKAKNITSQALKEVTVGEPKTDSNSAQSGKPESGKPESITLYYHPVLQSSFRQSIQGALKSTLQIVQSREVVRKLYQTLNDQQIPDTLETQIISNQAQINEIPVSRDGSRSIPNASQHNIPAWTVFAMFFVVISLGASVVREKLSGSFVRLKTLPTNYLVALLSKQITYIAVTFLQALVIFSIGVLLFPYLGLPKLNLPSDLLGLLLVTLISGWCASSYAICIGVFAKTQEQSNGIGAVSIVLLAAIGGILVPAFAMPSSFQVIMQISPLHWCLEAYYGLFLEGGKLSDILINILPLLIITIAIQLITLVGLKRKNLI
ncbi:MAG: ABC transporter permease [Chitinophagaceae bacterium]|nr:MAG: ABC transporter permease [Chitinophagaceae bacterium]